MHFAVTVTVTVTPRVAILYASSCYTLRFELLYFTITRFSVGLLVAIPEGFCIKSLAVWKNIANFAVFYEICM